ncbi:MAG TPA: hypothetical protein VJT15_10300 [Pyrinomonadaceae bacterium]|nr:hypothetical protein [Pyrinomonadaceae bacterium]
MGRSSQFNRDGDADLKKVVTSTGPLGLVPIMYFIATIVFLIMAIVFWRS